MKPDILKQSLRQSPIPANAHGPLLQELWGRDSIGEKSKNVLDMSPFWEYYSKRAKRSFLDRAHPFFLEDHADVVPIFQSVLSDSSREDIKHDILVRHNKPTVAAGKAGAAVTAADINDAIDLCASLATMTEVKLDSKSGGLTGRHVIQWTEGSLRQALASHFVPQTRLDHSGNSKLGKQFTARNLVRIGGIKVKWTTCLTNHLRLVDDDQVVFIFHCVSFLQLQESLENNVFPESFVKETLVTLALLFPFADKSTQQWLSAQRRKSQAPPIDGKLGKCGTLLTYERRLENFSYWHDRLVILKEAFDESQPKSLAQWWFDRRNGPQWYTFWVAILLFVLALVFGVVQCVEGGLQVAISYRSLVLQEAQA